MILFYLDGQGNTPANGDKVFQQGSSYVLDYPCQSNNQCYNYYADLPPGKYTISLYGASGGSGNPTAYTALKTDHSDCIGQKYVTQYGGNTYCSKTPSQSGAGGYTSGILALRKKTRAYISIGGAGGWLTGSVSYDVNNRPKGGYNGGGDGARDPNGCGGGGGATDFRLLENDLWHRVLVAGGGGGADNPGGKFTGSDDGSGGAGGGKEAQGFWIDGIYQGNKIATQTNGFTFGNGESSQKDGSKGDGVKNAEGADDKPGAGGGWFGGYAGHHGNGGSGGGSSFAFTEDATIPENPITSHSSYYDEPESHNYAFNQKDHIHYFFTKVHFYQGIWNGNGKAIIIYHQFYITCKMKMHNFAIFFLFCSILI